MSRTSRYASPCPTEVEQKRWRVGAYIRLSREDEGTQRADSESVRTQKKLLERHLRALEDAELTDEYIDDGYSGTTLDRPALRRLWEDWESQRINCVIVKDLSRLSRSHEDAERLLFVILPFFKVRFISVNDRVDSYLDPGSVQQLTVHFKNIMNDEYSRDLSKKIRSASTVRRRRGEFLGAFAPYGYKKDTDRPHRLVIDEEAARGVRLIYESLLGGMSYTQIARHLTDLGLPTPLAHKKKHHPSFGLPNEAMGMPWSADTVKRIASSDVYVGNLTQSKHARVSYKSRRVCLRDEAEWITVEGTHDPIVSAEEFAAAQAIIRARAHTKKPASRPPHVLAGIIRCGHCRRAMALAQNFSEGAYRAYYCTTYYRHKGSCQKNRIDTSAVERTVLAVLNRHLQAYGEMSRALARINEQMERKAVAADTASRVRELKQKKTALYQDYKDGKISRDGYTEQRARLDALCSSLADKEQKADTLKGNRFLESFKDRNGFCELTRDVATTFLRAVYVYAPDRIEIELNYADEMQEVADYLAKSKPFSKNDAVFSA